MPIEGYVIQNVVEMIVYALVAIVIGGPFARVLARRLDRRDVQPAELQDIAARLAKLEQVADGTAAEVARITELQRFTSRLLAAELPQRADRSPPSAYSTR